MNTIIAKTSMERSPYGTKLKEQLRRNRITYYERIEGNSLIIEIRAKDHKDSCHKEYDNIH